MYISMSEALVVFIHLKGMIPACDACFFCEISITAITFQLIETL